tara:strand:- start:185 stop:400 length:216 start_codon:yes stop_codon:yes gene_type:complete
MGEPPLLVTPKREKMMQQNDQAQKNDQELESKMQIRFDQAELDDFYNCFEPMDIQQCLDEVHNSLTLTNAA